MAIFDRKAVMHYCSLIVQEGVQPPGSACKGKGDSLMLHCLYPCTFDCLYTGSAFINAKSCNYRDVNTHSR